MRRRAVAAGLVLALAAAGSCSRPRARRRPSRRHKAAWIYVGPHNDGGWSQAHDEGRLAVQKALGSKVEDDLQGERPRGPAGRQVIESLIRDGNKMIFATSFGFQTAMVAAAKKHPDVYFEMATGTAQSKNLAEYFGASEDAIYLSGMAAGAATKKGVIGYVVPFPIPEVIRHANAFALGAQAMRPGAKVRLVWTHNWVRPEEGAPGGREPRRRGRGRHRPERRQPVGGPVRGVEEDPVGRLQLGRAEVRADVVAHRRALRLGRLLRPAREGGDERHVEDGLLLREHQGRLHRARPVRAKRVTAKTRAAIRAKREALIIRASSTSSPGRSTTRRGSSASRRARS